MIIDPRVVPAITSYRMLVGAIVPRPIAFVSTLSADGVYNLAPFSFCNAVCAEPPVVSFCPTVRVPPKDTLANLQATKEFVINIVSEEIAEHMNVCAGEYSEEVDEFELSGLTPIPSDIVRPPRARIARQHGVPGDSGDRGQHVAAWREPRSGRGRPVSRGRCGRHECRHRSRQAARDRAHEREFIRPNP
jgi:hypothetical protein